MKLVVGSVGTTGHSGIAVGMSAGTKWVYFSLGSWVLALNGLSALMEVILTNNANNPNNN